MLEVRIDIETAALEPGIYHATLLALSNDPVRPVVDLPVSLEVHIDTDGDGVGDPLDNCPDVANPDQADREGDGSGDACQPRLDLEGIQQDGGELLEVRALASDPQGDALSGRIEIFGERIGEAMLLEIPFTDGLPRRSPLQGMEAGQEHRLTINLTDGSTLPVSAEATFLYQGESEMIVNHPPQAVIQAPAVAECDRPAGREIVLDGSASSDPNSTGITSDDIVSFEWIEDPGGPGERLLGASAVYPVMMSIGDHLVGLRVTDSQGESDIAMLNITVRDTQPPELVCAPATEECSSPAGAGIVYAATVSDLCSPTIAVVNDRTPAGADASDTYPLGSTAVNFTATDAYGNVGHCATTMTVNDTTLPTLTVESLVPLLWPPNHRMVMVPIAWLASDDCDANPTIVLESVASSESDDAPGDGDGSTTGDIGGADYGMPDTEVLLRAERAGTGLGRLYSLAYRLTDESQNSTQGLAVVSVPHDLGTGPEPLLMHLEPNGLQGMASLYWPALPGSLGYDLIAVDLSDVSLLDGHLDLASAQVLGRGTPETSLHEDAGGPMPLLGQAIIYLIQQRTAEGGNGYGTATAPWPRQPSLCNGGCP
jgi:hypothetical protein